jgi:endo-1,4-beta-D-glucanase Y
MGPYGLFYWKVSPDGNEKTSASVDDLRIANAAAMAYRNWSDPKYQDMAEKLSRSILQHEVQDGLLVDFLNWREEGPPIPARVIQLSYIDTFAMDTLVQYDAEWARVLKRSGEVLLGGQRESGLFYEQYNLDTGQYEGEEQNVINQLYCALFAFFVDPKNDRFTVWLKTRFEEDGKIYAQYNSKTGEPMQWFESTSVYALAARYAYITGEKELAGALFAKMLSFQNRNRWSPMYGGFYDDEVFSFDNLEALITLRLFNNAG